MAGPKLIGLTGKAGHGKDTVAGLLGVLGVERAAFADALKVDAFWTLIQAPQSPYLPIYESAYGSPLEFINYLKHIPAIRSFLQHYGQAMRDANPDYWVNRCLDKLRPGRRYVITDVRYVNEADAIKARGGIVVRVLRPDFDNGLTPEAQAHSSETELDEYPWDTVLVNDGDLEQLLQEIRDNFVVQRYLRQAAFRPPTRAKT